MLSGAVCYAAKALSFLASHDEGAALVREIAEATGVPGAYLAKIVNALARKGFVTTQRGVGGGVTLAREPSTITLLDLCVALDDPIVESRCMLEQMDCSEERSCPAHEFWTEHRNRTIEFLRRTCIQDLALFEARQLERAQDAG